MKQTAILALFVLLLTFFGCGSQADVVTERQVAAEDGVIERCVSLGYAESTAQTMLAIAFEWKDVDGLSRGEVSGRILDDLVCMSQTWCVECSLAIIEHVYGPP